MLNPQIGLVNSLLADLGRPPIAFFQSPTWALPSVALTTVWQNLGFTFIVLSAGLQAVPEELSESARIDGAGGWRRLWHVTLPLLSPMLLFAAVVLGDQRLPDLRPDRPPHPGRARRPHPGRRVLDLHRGRPGTPSTAAVYAVALFAIVFVLTLLQLRVLERRVVYG